MAMSGTVLGTLIWTNIKSRNPPAPGPAEDSKGLAEWIAIATDIVTHIKTTGVVNATGPDPQGGSQVVVGTVT